MKLLSQLSSYMIFGKHLAQSIAHSILSSFPYYILLDKHISILVIVRVYVHVLTFNKSMPIYAEVFQVGITSLVHVQMLMDNVTDDVTSSFNNALCIIMGLGDKLTPIFEGTKNVVNQPYMSLIHNIQKWLQSLFTSCTWQLVQTQLSVTLRRSRLPYFI